MRHGSCSPPRTTECQDCCTGAPLPGDAAAQLVLMLPVAVTLAGLNSTANASSGTGVAAGGHARVAVNIGGLSGDGPRRSGFAIGVDAHPMFLSTGRSLSLTAGLGAEWY